MKQIKFTEDRNLNKNSILRGRPPKRVDTEKLQRLRNAGLSYRRLSKAMNISVKTVVKHLDHTKVQTEKIKIPAVYTDK